MTLRLLVLPLLAGALAAGPALAAEPAVPRIAPGVTAGGIDVSGLSVRQAAQKLKVEGLSQLSGTLVLGVAGRPFKLRAKDARVAVNGTRTAEAALARGAEPGDVPLVVTHDPRAVGAFVGSVARSVYKAPRNATLRITLRKMFVRRSKQGQGLDQARARRLVTAAYADPAASRVLHQRVTKLRAPVNANDLRRRSGTVVTIDKRNFRLRLFKQLKFSKSYGIATGLPAYPTPSGLYAIQNKQVNPTWSVPNSPWAGELQGTTVAGGTAANPLKARWLGIVNGIGIHGTGQEYSIGSRASHGCLRMRVRDVIDLYPRVPVGTPVLIG